MTSVDGRLIISDNATLSNLQGLENLTSVGGYLEITGNAGLTSLNGLENLTSVGRNLYIFKNIALTSLVALESLSSVGVLSIQYNDSLTSLELNKLNYVSGSFSILENQELCTSLVEDLKAQIEAGKGIGGYEFIYNNKPDC